MAARALLRLALAALAAATTLDARAADATVATYAADASPPPGWSLGLGAREEYRFRGSALPAETDQDLHLALDLAAHDPAGKLAAAASLGLWWDLDAAPPGEPFGLASIRDPRNPWLDVYLLSAEYRNQGVLRTARAGRQVAEHGRPATFDGAYLRLQPLRSLGLFAFGGRTEHFFETGAGFFEDWLASAGVTVRPSPDLRLELDYRLLREAIDSLDAGRVDVTDHSYGAAVWWRQGEWLRTRAFVRGLDDRVSEAGAQASLHWLAVLAGLELRLRAQPTTLGELNESDNPFFLTLGPSLPHVRWRADAWKAWEPESFRLELHLGYEGRQLLGYEETAFNRNASRLGAWFVLDRLEALPGFDANLSLDRLSAGGSPFAGEGEWALGGALGYRRGRLRLEAGSQYQRFRYVYYRDLEELADVRVFWAGARFDANDWLSVRLRYGLELFDRILHGVTVSLVQRF